MFVLMSFVVYIVFTVFRFLWRLVSITYMVSWFLRICDMVFSSISFVCWGIFTVWWDRYLDVGSKVLFSSYGFYSFLGGVLFTGRKLEVFSSMGSFRVVGMMVGLVLGVGVEVTTGGRVRISSWRDLEFSGRLF